MRTLVLSVVLAISFLPIPLHGEHGLYNAWSGLIWCEPAACVHEVGHKLDDMSSWVSKTPEFQQLIDEMGLDLWANYQEDYAEIYALAKGRKENMPIVLQGFYEWDLSEELLEEYEYGR